MVVQSKWEAWEQRRTSEGAPHHPSEVCLGSSASHFDWTAITFYTCMNCLVSIYPVVELEHMFQTHTSSLDLKTSNDGKFTIFSEKLKIIALFVVWVCLSSTSSTCCVFVCQQLKWPIAIRNVLPMWIFLYCIMIQISSYSWLT